MNGGMYVPFSQTLPENLQLPTGRAFGISAGAGSSLEPVFAFRQILNRTIGSTFSVEEKVSRLDEVGKFGRGGSAVKTKDHLLLLLCVLEE